MNEELQTEELSLLDIFRTLMRKFKILIVVLLASVVFGGAFGFLTTMNTHYYGTEIQFYVNPKDKEAGTNESTYGVYGAYGVNVMDNMIKLLESDLFTERLLLGGDKLPPKGLNDELDGLIAVAEEKYTACKEPYALISEKEKAYQEADEVFDEAWAKFVKEQEDSGAVVKSFKVDVCLENGYDISVKEAYQAREEARQAVAEVENEYAKQFAAYEKAKKAALRSWRTLERYQQLHDMITKSVKYSYLPSGENSENASNLARSFIYVEISVLGNEKFANTLLAVLRQEIVAFVSEKMIVPSGYVGTSCEETTTRSVIELTNEGYALKSAVTFAVLTGFLALVVAAVVVIILDRSDKRIRSYETLERQLNIPVLGIIPTIKEEQNNERGIVS
jgi:capsular polysaccharide biosynthesis protein